MKILATTNDVIRVVTDAAITVDVFASFIDKNGTTFTPGNQATAIIAATTTNIISAPAASTYRNVKSLAIRNKHASSSVNVTVQFFNGTTAYEEVKRGLAAGDTLTYEDGDGWEVIATGANVTRQILTTVGAGTYTTPSGVRAILVECIAGGAGGGGCATGATNGAAAGGGGGGAYAASFIASPAASYAYVVGDGGAGGTAGANNGTAGSDTTFNATTIVAKGGSGGVADTVAVGPRIAGAGGAGGLASGSTGDIKIDGNPGDAGLHLAAAQSLSGRGGAGAGAYEGGAAPAVKNATSAGTAGGKYGGGGSGASIISGGVSQAGGKGAQGVIVVTEFR